MKFQSTGNRLTTGVIKTVKGIIRKQSLSAAKPDDFFQKGSVITSVEMHLLKGNAYELIEKSLEDMNLCVTWRFEILNIFLIGSGPGFLILITRKRSDDTSWIVLAIMVLLKLDTCYLYQLQMVRLREVEMQPKKTSQTILCRKFCWLKKMSCSLKKSALFSMKLCLRLNFLIVLPNCQLLGTFWWSKTFKW